MFSHLLRYDIDIYKKISIFDISISICPPLPATLDQWRQISDLSPKWVSLASNGINPRLFQIRFSVHFGSPSQNVLKIWFEKVADFPHLRTIWLTLSEPKYSEILIWKSPGFVSFGDNLTRLGPNLYFAMCLIKYVETSHNHNTMLSCFYDDKASYYIIIPLLLNELESLFMHVSTVCTWLSLSIKYRIDKTTGTTWYAQVFTSTT